MTCGLSGRIGAGVGEGKQRLLHQHAVLRVQRDRLVWRHPEQTRLQ
jgi:hypothetical protein